MRVELRVGSRDPIVLTEPTLIRVGDYGVLVDEHGSLEWGRVDLLTGQLVPRVKGWAV